MHTETLGFLDVKLFYVLNSDPELLLFIYGECLDLCLYHLIFPILFNVDHSALIKMHLQFTKKKKASARYFMLFTTFQSLRNMINF